MVVFEKQKLLQILVFLTDKGFKITTINKLNKIQKKDAQNG